MALSPSTEDVSGFGNVPKSMYGDMDAAAVEDHRREVRLREFDIEVEHRLEQMRVEIRNAETRLKKKFTLALIKIPKNIKQMSLELFRSEYGGDMGRVQQKEAEIKIGEVLTMPPPPPPSSIRRSSRKRKPLENRTNTTSAGTAKKGAKKQRSDASEESKPAPSTIGRRSSRRHTQTPTEMPSTASSSRRSSRRTTGVRESAGDASDFKTPMVQNRSTGRVPMATPALDPRLPKTPYLRLAKRGESIMSINGSPIAQSDQPRVMHDGRDSSIISLNLQGGKVLHLEGIQSIKKVSRTLSKRAKKDALSQLERLQEQIAQMQAQLTA